MSFHILKIFKVIFIVLGIHYLHAEVKNKTKQNKNPPSPKKQNAQTESLAVVQISLYQWQSLIALSHAHFPRSVHKDLY